MTIPALDISRYRTVKVLCHFLYPTSSAQLTGNSGWAMAAIC